MNINQKELMDALKKLEESNSPKQRRLDAIRKGTNPLQRDPDTWSDADREYVKLRAAEEAAKLANRNRSSKPNKDANAANDEYQRLLLAEMQRLAPSQSFSVPDLFNLNDEEPNQPSGNLFR